MPYANNLNNSSILNESKRLYYDDYASIIHDNDYNPEVDDSYSEEDEEEQEDESADEVGPVSGGGRKTSHSNSDGQSQGSVKKDKHGRHVA